MIVKIKCHIFYFVFFSSINNNFIIFAIERRRRRRKNHHDLIIIINLHFPTVSGKLFLQHHTIKMMIFLSHQHELNMIGKLWKCILHNQRKKCVHFAKMRWTIKSREKRWWFLFCMTINKLNNNAKIDNYWNVQICRLLCK